MLTYVSKFTIINTDPTYYHKVVDIVMKQVHSFTPYLMSSGQIASKASYSEVQVTTHTDMTHPKSMALVEVEAVAYSIMFKTADKGRSQYASY